jgi:hypothetical protein
MIFSTVLEVEGKSILYNVYKNNSVAFLSPKQHTRVAPILYAVQQNQDWVIRGTNDHSIIKQAYREIADF